MLVLVLGLILGGLKYERVGYINAIYKGKILNKGGKFDKVSICFWLSTTALIIVLLFVVRQTQTYTNSFGKTHSVPVAFSDEHREKVVYKAMTNTEHNSCHCGAIYQLRFHATFQSLAFTSIFYLATSSKLLWRQIQMETKLFDTIFRIADLSTTLSFSALVQCMSQEKLYLVFFPHSQHGYGG